MIADVHHIAAPLVAAAAALLLVVVLVGAARGRPVRLAADRAILLALAFVAFGVLTGAAVLIGGPGPKDLLHFVYALVALAVLPLARFWDRLGRRRALALAVAAVVLAAMALRLFQTG